MKSTQIPYSNSLREPFFFYNLTVMLTYHISARPPATRRRLLRFNRQSFSFAILTGMLLLTTACVRQPSSEPAADPQGSSYRKEEKLDMDVVEAARSKIGVRYRYGGSTPATGFDCSGLVCWSYQQTGIQLPRSARDQVMFGLKVEERKDLKPGDIVVFKGTRGRSGWHSGIYSGNGKFVHSPGTGKTVTESSMEEAYYVRRFAGARRIPRDGSASALYAQYEARQKERALAEQHNKKTQRRTLASNTGTNAVKKASVARARKDQSKGARSADAVQKLAAKKAAQGKSGKSEKVHTAKKGNGNKVTGSKGKNKS